MYTLENRVTFASNTESTIAMMGLESYEPYEPQPLNLPELITPAEVAQAIAASLEAGNDPTEDPDVQKALAQREIAGYTLLLQTQHEDAESYRHVSAIRAQAPALIAEMKQTFDTAADVLRAAHKVLGDEPLWDRNAYPAGDKNALLRLKAQAAMYETDRIVQNWPQLMLQLEGPGGSRTEIQHYAVPTVDDFNRLGPRLGGHDSTGRKTGVWDMLMMGIPVDLATSRAEVQERLEKNKQLKAKQSAHARDNAFRGISS